MLFTQLYESFDGAGSLNVGDPVIITGKVQFQGKTGDIAGFGKDKRFVIVDLYNHGKHSFNSSDVEYNEYADSDDEEAQMYDRGEFRDEELDEGYAKFGAYYAEQLAKKVFDERPHFQTKGRADELIDYAWRFAVQDLGKSRARYEFNYDEDFLTDFVSAYGWLQDGGNPETGEDGQKQEVTEGMDIDQLAGTIAARLERMAPNVFSEYGVEYVLEAVRDVAEFYAMSDFEELGSSDIGAMARNVIRNLQQREAQMNRGV